MSESNSSRPRLVSVAGEPPEKTGKPAGETARESTAATVPRSVAWLLALLALAALAGLVSQNQRARTLQGENEALAGELFAARTALDAYTARFADVRSSIEGLQAQIEQLDALVSGDPLASPLETEPAPAPAD